MSEPTALEALRQKRAELQAQVQQLHAEIYHIDHAIRLLGGRVQKNNRMLASGELMRLIGAEQSPRHRHAYHPGEEAGRYRPPSHLPHPLERHRGPQAGGG